MGKIAVSPLNLYVGGITNGVLVFILIILGLFLVFVLLSFVLNSDDRKGKFCFGIVVFWVYSIGLALLVPKVSMSAAGHFGGHIFFIVFFGSIVLVRNLEGCIRLYLYIKHAFSVYPSGDSSKSRRETARSEWEQRQEERMEKNQQKESKKQEQKTVARERAVRGKLEEIEDSLVLEKPGTFQIRDINNYLGWIGEVERRFQEGQIAKSIRATREKLEEAKRLYQELREIEIAEHDYHNVKREITTRDLKAEADLADARVLAETTDMRIEVEKLRLEVEKAKLMEQLNPKPKPKPKRESDVEKMNNRRKKMDDIRKGKEEALAGIDPEKEPERYTETKRMWDDLYLEARDN